MSNSGSGLYPGRDMSCVPQRRYCSPSASSSPIHGPVLAAPLYYFSRISHIEQSTLTNQRDWKVSTLEMVTSFEVEVVESYFCEFSLRYHSEAMVSCHLETVKVIHYRFSGILPIRCYISNRQFGHNPIELFVELHLQLVPIPDSVVGQARVPRERRLH